MKRICSKCSRVRFPARLLDMRKTQFVEPTLYYNVNPTKSCRDAFLRLSKPPGLRKRRFHSAFLLAETQECVSTLCNDRLCAQAEIRRIHVKYTAIFIYATKKCPFPHEKLGGNGLALDHVPSSRRGHLHYLIINSHCLMRLRLAAKSARYLIIILNVSLLFAVFTITTATPLATPSMVQVVSPAGVTLRSKVPLAE